MFRQVFGIPRSHHQPSNLVGRLGRQALNGRQGPKVPLHIVVAETVVRPAFLGADEMLELHGSRTKNTGVLLPTMS